MSEVMDFLFSVGLGVGLAAACGFRVFLPILIMGLAARSGFMELTDGFEWMAGSLALLTFAVAVTCEIGSYYIPWLDNLLDAAAMPAAVTGGVVVGAANIETATPLLDWGLAAVAGGGSAAVVQTGTTLLRGASTAITAGLGNPVVSTAENGAAIGLSVLAIVVPMLALATVLMLVFFVVAGLRRRFRRRQAES